MLQNDAFVLRILFSWEFENSDKGRRYSAISMFVCEYRHIYRNMAVYVRTDIYIENIEMWLSVTIPKYKCLNCTHYPNTTVTFVCEYKPVYRNIVVYYFCIFPPSKSMLLYMTVV